MVRRNDSIFPDEAAPGRGPHGSRIGLLLAEETTVLRQGIQELLRDSDRIEVVGQTADGLKALALAQKLRPALALLEITLPSLNGIEVTRRIRRTVPGTRVLIYTRLRGPQYMQLCLRAGASGFLEKDATFEELLAAMEMVAEGGSFFSAGEPGIPLEGGPGPGEKDLLVDGLDRLTRRERQILRLICEGQTNRKIAERLRISIKTVDTHRGHLMKKLDLHHVTDLTKFAIHRGIIDLPPV